MGNTRKSLYAAKCWESKRSHTHVHRQASRLWLQHFSCSGENYVAQFSPSLHQSVSSAGGGKTDIHQTHPILQKSTHTRRHRRTRIHQHVPNLGQTAIKISTKSCAMRRWGRENNRNGCGMPTGLCYTFLVARVEKHTSRHTHTDCMGAFLWKTSLLYAQSTTLIYSSRGDEFHILPLARFITLRCT